MSSQTTEAEPRHITRSFHVVTKPIGSLCNLNCRYCYYLHKEDLLHDKELSGIKHSSEFRPHPSPLPEGEGT